MLSDHEKEMQLVEMDSRERDGIFVTLYTDSETYSRAILYFCDSREGIEEMLDVPANAAMDAFCHPALYVSHERYSVRA